MIKIGKYSVCVLDLVTDSKTGRLSTSKIWQHIGFGAMTYSMMQHPPTFDTIAAYGAVVAGNHVLIHFLKWKYRDKLPDAD